MNQTAVKEKQTHNQLLFVKNKLMAAADGQLPERLELIKAGVWTNSWKGDLEITVADLLEMKLNFAKGIGLPGGGSAGAPIDFAHADWDKAAGWIKALEVDEVAGILYASEIEWTKSGREAIEGGDFKFFSPSVFPACLGTWSDPEDPTHTAQNVLMGGGLTNIPFFKGLTGLKASTSPDGGKENVIYLANEGEDMDLAVLRTKKKEELNTEEAAFLAEHKSELTAEEQITTGVTEVAPETPAVPTPAEAVITNQDSEEVTATPEAVALQASITAGTHVVIKKEDFANLQASAQASASKLAEIEKEKVQGRVEAHVARGAIKADQADKWIGLILADASNEALLTELPDNQLLASAIGAEGKEGSSLEALRTKARDIMGADGKVDFSAALSQARKENPELAKSADAEIKSK